MDLQNDKQSAINYLQNHVHQSLDGHSNDEVLRLKELGYVNVVESPPSRTIRDIIMSNVFTIFNAILISLSVIMILLGFFKESLFVVPVIINMFTGIFQELRTKQTIDKMGIVEDGNVIVIREGQQSAISQEEIVIDDIIVLKQGMQIPVDLISIDERDIDIDESLLTGESDPVAKHYSDVIYAGSFVISGTIYAQAFRIGHDTYVSKLSDEARKYKQVHSELRTSTNKIMVIIAWCIVILSPLAVIAYMHQYAFRDAMYVITPVIAGMVPEGLILLTTVTLMLGVVTLMERNTLVQEMAAIETLARVDVLCLDKTGTITEGTFDVDNIDFFHEDEAGQRALIELIVNDEDRNSTSAAIFENIERRDKTIFTQVSDFTSTWQVSKSYPFNSKNKWSGMTFTNGETWVIGAPEFIFPAANVTLLNMCREYAKDGFRTIGLARVDKIEDNKFIGVHAYGVIKLSDRIRVEAPDTFKYFKEQDVELKVISGDNPETVRAVAVRAGLGDNIKAVDARTLPHDITELADALQKYTVFGRVSPHQKQNMVKALQFKGHTVGMTGDGVNDILALKEADCAIAMNSGSEASKAVSQFVLLDSNFSTLPTAVAAGRRSINNIQSVASIFLVKNIYSILFTVITVAVYLFSKLFLTKVIVLGYPFDPMYFSLISSVSIGYPATMLALLPNNNRVKGTFMQNIIKVSIPSAVMIVLGIVIFWFLQANSILFIPSNNASAITDNPGLMQFQFVSMMFTVWMQFYAVIRSSLPLTIWKALIIVINIFIFIAAFFIPFISDFLNISRALPYCKAEHYIVPIIFAVIGMALAFLLEKCIEKYYYNK